jgi:hypothetical protein
VSDQREHGVGGLEWRDRPAGSPDEPLVPSTGAMGAPDDATTVFPAVRGDDGGPAGHDPAGESDSADSTRGADADADTRRFGVLPAPTGWPDGTEQDGPVDLSAMRADDDLLTALVSFDNSTTGPDQDPELKSLLLSWRLDVDAEPIGDLVDTDTALTTIAVGAQLRHRRRRPRYLLPVAAAAAALVVLTTGMGVAARTAVPGDPLWGISQVLYTDHARSVEAAALVRNDLHHASEAILRGRFEEARSALVQAQASLPSVDNADGKANLQAQQQNLLTQLDNTTSSTSVPTNPVDTSLATTAAPPNSSADSPTAPTSPESPNTTTDNPPSTTTDNPPSTTTDNSPPATSTGTAGDAPNQPNQPAAGNAPQDQTVNQAAPDGGTSDAGTSTGTGVTAGN